MAECTCSSGSLIYSFSGSVFKPLYILNAILQNTPINATFKFFKIEWSIPNVEETMNGTFGDICTSYLKLAR